MISALHQFLCAPVGTVSALAPSMRFQIPRFLLPLSILTVIGATACEGGEEVNRDVFPSDIELALFKNPVGFDNLDLQLLSPETPVSYVELRKQESFSEAFSIVSFQGEKCGAAADPATCETLFDELATSGKGFHIVEHPNDKHHYLAATRTGLSLAVRDAGEMKQFLGSVDNVTEALFLAASQGYEWSTTELSEGAVRQTDNGFELIVTQYSSCPAKTTGYHLSISTTGETSIFNSWVVHPDEGFCS